MFWNALKIAKVKHHMTDAKNRIQKMETNEL